MSFLTPELIRKKREGSELTSAEMNFLVSGFANGAIPDYQISAWLMAVFFKGMSDSETLCFTQEMKNSGDSLDWRSLHPSFKDALFADKHSTGGVGDKVSLVLAPLAACLGLKVPMMSGRGLGFTGGTVDKLQSISGFNMYLSDSERARTLLESGFCMMAQSEKLCPSDRKLYSLRDVTATIESLPLITGSIVSKKWAAGVENILYDVKCGSAAFMASRDAAVALAKSLVTVSKKAGMRAKATVTRMDEPLGSCVGNACEVRESVWILKNEFPSTEAKRIAGPLRTLCMRLSSEMAVLAGLEKNISAATAKCETFIASGQAYELFEKNVALQGGASNWWATLPQSKIKLEYKAKTSGTVGSIESKLLGIAGIEIGAGRARSEDKVDPSVGFELRVAVGDAVKPGQTLVECQLQDKAQFELVQSRLDAVFKIESGKVTLPPEDLVLAEI